MSLGYISTALDILGKTSRNSGIGYDEKDTGGSSFDYNSLVGNLIGQGSTSGSDIQAPTGVSGLLGQILTPGTSIANNIARKKMMDQQKENDRIKNALIEEQTKAMRTENQERRNAITRRNDIRSLMLRGA